MVRLELAVEGLVSGALAYSPMFAIDLVELSALAADCARADAAAAMLAQVAEVTGCAVHAGMGTLASAWAALARGVPDAVDLARQACGTFDDLDFPLLQGRAYDLLGRGLAGDDPEEAAAAFREAVVRFESCGATWRRDRALTEIERLVP